MSYEGYVQKLCEKGHYRTQDIFTSSTRFCSCGSGFIWINDVDDTNCDQYGKVELELDKEAVTHRCECGNVHVTEERTYKIPHGRRNIAAQSGQENNK